MASTKTRKQFYTNLKLSGAAPKNIIEKTSKETAINNAWKLLKKTMLVPYKGSKYPNKLNWSKAVQSLNQYNLSNAQKDLIRRVNIALAAQPTKGPIENRRRVKMNISKLTRNQALAAQKEAIKKENQEARNRADEERRRADEERRREPTRPVFKPTGSRATYGMF